MINNKLITLRQFDRRRSFRALPLRRRDILIKPLNGPAPAPGFMHITTALSEDNWRFVGALRALLSRA
ncbi:MAG: hypothetical protein ACYCWB_08420 [Thiobacillus sp.]